MILTEFKDFLKSHKKVTLQDGSPGHTWTLSSFQLNWLLGIIFLSTLILLAGGAKIAYTEYKSRVAEVRAEERKRVELEEHMELPNTKMLLGDERIKNIQISAELGIFKVLSEKSQLQLREEREKREKLELELAELTGKLDSAAAAERRLSAELKAAESRKETAIEAAAHSICDASLEEAKRTAAASEAKCKGTMISVPGQPLRTSLDLRNSALQAALVEDGDRFRRPNGNIVIFEFALPMDTVSVRAENQTTYIGLAEARAYVKNSSGSCFVRVVGINKQKRPYSADIEHWCE